MLALRHILLASAVALTLSGFAHAQTEPAAAASSSAESQELTDAEVRKIDKENKKLTLKHGPLKSLDMPGMTMVFQADEAMLDQVQVGDKIRFVAGKVEGKFTVVRLEAAAR